MPLVSIEFVRKTVQANPGKSPIEYAADTGIVGFPEMVKRAIAKGVIEMKPNLERGTENALYVV